MYIILYNQATTPDQYIYVYVPDLLINISSNCKQKKANLIEKVP
jgi:hypothetical protein